MLENLTFYLILVIITVLLVMLAKKIKVAYPVLLVLAGLGINFIPGTPTIHLEPELIFFIFLPPLLYEAAWATSWKELWRWRRIVVSFAFVVVFFTSLVEKEIDYEIRNELAKIGVKRIRDTPFEKLEKFPALQDQLQTWENRVNSSEVILNFPEYRRITWMSSTSSANG